MPGSGALTWHLFDLRTHSRRRWIPRKVEESPKVTELCVRISLTPGTLSVLQVPMNTPAKASTAETLARRIGSGDGISAWFTQ